MIYLLYGTDIHKARAKLHEVLDSLSKKRPNSEVFRITQDNWNEAQFDELLSARGLFDQKYIVVLDGIFEKKEIKEYAVDKLSEMKMAEHPFLILEGKIDSATLKKIETHSYKTQKFEKNQPAGEAVKSPIIFSIADKLYAKDKKKLWISYIDLIGQGISAEEIHGVIFWAVKNMIIASRVDSQKESGLAPFPYSKALSGGRNYKSSELQKMSSDLVEMVHLVRSGEGEMDVMLERWLLTL